MLLSPQTPASTEIRPEAMAVETQASGAASGSADGSPDNDSNTDVLKVIKKTEVEVLCPQHNPVCYLPITEIYCLNI